MKPTERYSDPQRALLESLDGWQSGIWTALPGEILAFDAGAVTVTVQPTIKQPIRQPDGSVQFVTLPVLPDVPVCFPRGGGYTLTFPIKAGDECLCIFSSRAIDFWWQSGGVQMPVDWRKHDLSDAFAIVGPMSQARKIGGISGSTTQLRADDGGIFVELDSGGGMVNVKAPTGIKLDAPTVTITGVVNVENQQGAGESGTFVGTIRATEDVFSAGVSGRHHTHGGIEPGSSNTDQPAGA